MTPILVERETDVARLARLHAQCFATPWTAATLSDLLQASGTFAFEIEGGFIIVRAASDEAEILTLAVGVEHRRTGKGASLVRAGACHAHGLGARRMFLEVGVSNVAARKLYEGLGFVEVGRRKGYYATGPDKFEDALILRSNLPLSPLGNRPTSG